MQWVKNFAFLEVCPRGSFGFIQLIQTIIYIFWYARQLTVTYVCIYALLTVLTVAVSMHVRASKFSGVYVKFSQTSTNFRLRFSTTLPLLPLTS